MYGDGRGELAYREFGNFPDGLVLIWAALYYYIITKKKFYFVEKIKIIKKINI
jgi:hypothetical protein